LKMSNKVVTLALMTIIFLSMQLSSLPLVSATYTIGYPYMPPDLEGDANNDGIVNIIDMSIVSHAYSSYPGHPNWDPRADLNNDEKVDILDMSIVSKNYGKTEDSPTAYSTTFEFTVPYDGNKEVWYYVLARIYVSSEEKFNFVASANDRVQNVKLDGASKAGSGSSVNIELGSLSSGYHLLEFEFVEIYGSGWLNFHVTTAAEEYARLVRFRVYIPNYSDNEYRYNITTHTNFPIDDHYFLKGYADDYIDDLYVDGLKWQDWEWNCTPYGTIYAWGDGFCYPLGERDEWRDIIITFGEIWGGGLLDFQYISWTHQQDRIGQPKFYAVGNAITSDYITITNARFYGGSKWKFEEDPEFSERYFEARLRFNASYDDGETWFNAYLEVGLGKGWAEWALLPATMDDVGITLNLTSIYFDSNLPESSEELPWKWWEVGLEDYTIDVYSFPQLEIVGMEFTDEGESIVRPDLTALDYLGTVIMFVSGQLAQPIGAAVGLGIKGIAAVARFVEGQSVCRFEETISEDHHRRLCAEYDLCTEPHELIAYSRSDNDVVFFKLNPAAGKHCGLTKVVLKGTLVARYGIYTGQFPPVVYYYLYPIADIEISIYIPWFLRG
jgi:hypothetical protein